MAKRCVAAGCSSTCKDGLHLYCFPKDQELRNEWADQIKQTRDQWKPDTIIQLIPICAASILEMTAFIHTTSKRNLWEWGRSDYC